MALIVVGTGALAAVYGLGSVGISGQYDLLWGSQLTSGQRVELDAPFAPTPHPLTIAIAGLAGRLGGSDVVALSIVQLAALSAMLVALWLFAAELFDRWVATLSIGLLALCPLIVTWSFDGPKSSLWIIALALAGRAELRTRRAGAGVLWPLALLGLVRPDAWALAALYCGYLWYERDRRRAVHALAFVAPPLIWLALDWVMTGDPLGSMHRTHTLRAALDRETGIGAAVNALPRLVEEPLGTTLALTGLLGALLAVAVGHRRALAALGVAGVLVGGFLAQSGAGFSVIANYLAPVHLLALVFAAAALRATWSCACGRPALALVASAVTAAAILVQIPDRLEEHQTARSGLRDLALSWSDLKAVAPVEDAEKSCGPVDLSGPYGPRALLALHLERNARSLRDSTMQRSLPGLHIVPTDAAAGDALARPAFVRRRPQVPAGARLVRRNATWSLWELCSPAGGAVASISARSARPPAQGSGHASGVGYHEHHGGSPDSHIASSSIRSRRVSIAFQKPRWR